MESYYATSKTETSKRFCLSNGMKNKALHKFPLFQDIGPVRNLTRKFPSLITRWLEK